MSDNWQNVGRAVKRARQERRLSIRDACAAAGLSTTTWISAEKGMRISELTQVGIAEALGWPPDAIDRLLDGSEFQPVEDHTPQAEVDGDVIDAKVISSLSEESRRTIMNIIRSDPEYRKRHK